MSAPASPDALLALAERCEAAAGPDRAIDYDICHFVTRGHMKNGAAPAYTASLDAAMMLVPGDHWATFDPHFMSDPGVVKYRGFTFRADWARWTPHDDWIERDEGNPLCATPALALTAAALRASLTA